ncbi:SDR family oxidoreductase [Actinospica sp. MGRD01-02]|uniref:SDR family oxidoreductase n=1 Tax=Actinospica acidithermotolerans TaxID=2828514 RepID=A0A941E5W3_9ACTN|nr:SDR family oxidoreductase [Actinospica acidithermotolerans]MBR7825696.1 SDR family oxidoreductase [Actinospica acidithermotolerans]
MSDSTPGSRGGARDVVVVTGAGGMGAAVARRLGSGRALIIADASRTHLDNLVEALRAEGHVAHGVHTDVSDRGSVEKLAAAASSAGERITAIVHTAGVSAATATARQIIDVDLVGTAHIIDVFETVATRGTALVCIASMAGHAAQLTREDEAALATAPTQDLCELAPVVAVEDDPMSAYLLAKRANQVRVQAAALAWNLRGARVNTVSPGVISTPMAKQEAESHSGGSMLDMLDACGIGRTGTPAEIAEAAAFLTSPAALYITGTDLLVDGGQAGWLRWHMPAEGVAH